MSDQTYSQVVGDPDMNMDIEKIVEGAIEIKNYDDIEKVNFKYKGELLNYQLKYPI